MMIKAVYIFLLCIGASFVQRTTGFGFGIFIMTILPFLMPSLGEATTLSGILALTSSMMITFRMRKFITWKRLIPILVTFILTSAVAISLLHSIQDHILKLSLGAVLIITSLYFIFCSNKIKVSTKLPMQIGAGCVSGFMGGFFGMQGPPAVLYFISSEPDKEHYMAIVSAYFLLGNGAMTIARAANGFFTKTVMFDYICGLGGVAIGTAIGSWVFSRIPSKIFRYVVYAYIGISGIIVMLTA